MSDYAAQRVHIDFRAKIPMHVVFESRENSNSAVYPQSLIANSCALPSTRLCLDVLA